MGIANLRISLPSFPSVRSFKSIDYNTKNPEDFLEDISDATELNIYFKDTPNFSNVGKQDISIILEDQGMNTLELNTVLTLDEDKIPPIISGVKNQSIFLGKVVSYRKGVSIEDNKDSNIELKIDSSNVNTKKIGTYEVFYSATDSSSNTTSAVSKIIVKEKPKDFIDRKYVDNLADKILSRIIKEDMTDKEKLWEIFAWTKWHITYTGHSDKSDWLTAAVQGIKKASGDCFNYYATEKALLEKAGFETISLERIETAPTRHYWVLVKYMGSWYHFDTTQTFSEYPYDCFLKTDAQVEEYTEKVSGLRKDYFTYDKSKYPKVATEIVN